MRANLENNAALWSFATDSQLTPRKETPRSKHNMPAGAAARKGIKREAATETFSQPPLEETPSGIATNQIYYYTYLETASKTASFDTNHVRT